MQTTPPVEKNISLAAIEERLDLLLKTGREGNWDDVAASAEKIKSLMDEVRRIDFNQRPGELPGETVASIQRLISRLEIATKIFGERKQQIAPLVDALTRLSDKPSSP